MSNLQDTVHSLVAELGIAAPDTPDLDAQFRELDYQYGHELAGQLAKHVQKMNAAEYCVAVGQYTVKVTLNAAPLAGQ